MVIVDPKQAPVYGGIEITYNAGEQRRNDVDRYYLVFFGSEVRHVVAATAVWNHQGKLLLKATVPGHSKLEPVEVRGYVCSGSDFVGPVGFPSALQYVSDSAHRMAVYLSESVEKPENLVDLELVCVDEFQLTSDVQANLDERLTLAFKALKLSPCWNMMGTPRHDGAGLSAERLVHFSARLGLAQLTAHFLTLPGSQAALSSTNHEGFLPEHLALKAGFHELADLLQYYRKQASVNISVDSPVLAKSPSPPGVVTSQSILEENLERHILNLDRKASSSAATRVETSNDLEERNMKELHLSKNGVSGTSTFYTIDNGVDEGHPNVGRSTSLPRPASQGRVLEENLRRLRNIHEGIQKLRQLNTKQIVEHQSQKSGAIHLSNSCPTLYPNSTKSDNDNTSQSNSLLRMRTLHHRQTSLSSNSRSLDSTLFDTINVKIHINDITPSVSQECLQPTSPVSEEDEEAYRYDRLLRGSTKSQETVSTIGGTASRRLAKKSTKKGPVRRQSWSSLGASLSQDNVTDKQSAPRRWSLSSLDSDAEEAFSDAAECFSDQAQQFSPSSSSVGGTCSYKKSISVSASEMEKSRMLSDGSNEESSLSKSAKQSVSVPSMRDITVDIKENVKPASSHGSDSLNEAAKGFLASFRSSPLQKSLSTPAIAIEDNAAAELQKISIVKDERPTRQSLCVMPPSSSEESRSPASPEAEDLSRSMCQPVSLAGVLRESQRLTVSIDSDEEKPFAKRKKRSSIFFKKKPDKHKGKESKKNPHQFVVCHGSSANCDVCNKPFIKKQALKCESCLIIVHDNSCKDQTVDCNKFKLQSTTAKTSYLPVSKDSYGLSATINGSTTHAQNKNLTAHQQHRGFFTVGQTGIPSLSEAATRSSFVNLGKMISEENDGSCDTSSNIMDINSASMESLDEGAVEISDLEDNPILRLIEEEPENWHATVDKKTLKKLKDREVKRQEAIYELIITEKHHFLTLQIMQKVYAQGMIKELGMSRETVDRLLPCVNELLELHRMFLTQLRERQNENPIVENIADVLEEQFHEQRAEQMQVAYGQFCSQHIEALNLYKEWIKSDRKFQNFIKKCGAKRFCKTKGIPECLLLVTQRITKYILVIESLIKAAKDSKEEQTTLTKVLNNLKQIIYQVNFQVAEKERELRLLEIFNRMEPKAAIFYRGKKFKKIDLISNNRRLIKEGSLAWSSIRGKTIDVLAVMVSDLIFFLHENNQKYCFASLENKPGIVSLQKLLVRRKAGQDSRGFYLISSNPNEPEMIELLCRTAKDQKAWMEAVREAVEQCPEEDEGVPSETEQERKLEAARNARVKELMNLLHEKDLGVAQLCEDKMRLLIDMLEVVGVDTEQYENVKYTNLVESDFSSETRDLISAAISNASRLANSLYASGTNLSRSVSSAGEHHSEAYVSPILPKRAETFGGFDNPSKEPVVTNKVPVLKKKLLHLKENTEVTNFFPSKPKPDVDFEMADSLETALRGFDSRTRSLSRPSSVCGSPDQQNRKTSVSPSVSPQNSIVAASRELSSDLTHLSVTPLLVSQGKEQLVQIVELAHYLNTVMCSVSHLSSTVENLKVQVSQVNEKMSKLTKEKEVREKRHQYRPEHQLEELRNLQKQLNHDKAVWQQEKAQHEIEIKTQREELERIQEQLKNEQEDVTHQRELLYRKLDALQRQGIILSPSHTVLNNCLTRDSDTPKESTISPSDATAPEFPQHHKRTFSYDSHNEPPREVVQHLNAGYGSPPGSVAMRQESKHRPSVHSVIQPSSSKVMPMHLSSSATNLQKRQTITAQPVKQQLPLKLANTHGAAGNVAAANGAMSLMVAHGPQQVLPMKLAHGSLPSNIPALIGTEEAKSAVPKRSHSVANSPSSTLTAPVHVRGGSSPALVSYPPNSGLSLSPNASNRSENLFQQLKLVAEKAKNKKDRDSNEEIFC